MSDYSLFSRHCTPENEIIETLVLIAEGGHISSLARVKGHKEDTIIAWIRDAAEHCRRSNNMRMDVWQEPRVIYGDNDEVLELMGKSTAYIERTHLTMRFFNSRLTRKTLATSKLLEMYRASTAWDDIIYNLVRPLKSLRVVIFNNPNRRWINRPHLDG